jgi:hypothetical protein
MRYQKVYALDRASSLLPLLVRIAGEMAMRCRRIARLRRSYREIRNEPSEGAANSGALDRLRAEYDGERAAFESCLRELEALGGWFVCHDPMTIHLLGELPTGMRVVLCWSVGEKALGSYHPVGLEDAPRQPLAPSLPPPPLRPSLPAPFFRPDA